MDMLSGIRVLSFNHFMMGPAGVQHLADLGADVIAIESPEGSFQRKFAPTDKWINGQTGLFLCANRNKRSLAIDLKAPAGREIVEKLIAKSDVITENFRPGVMDKLGFGYEAAKTINPGIVYCSASGYGTDGPYRHRPGQDLLVQALSGLAASTGSADGDPHPVGTSVVDHHGAALMAMGVLAALLRRQRTGEGGRVEVNLLSAALDLQVEPLTLFLNGAGTKEPRGPGNIGGWYYSAPYGVYPTADGHIAISLAEMKDISAAIGVAALASIPQADSFRRREEISCLIRDATRQRPTAHWLEIFEKAGIWHAPVQDFDAVKQDPQVRHNGSLVTVDDAGGNPITLVAHPVRYDGHAPEVRFPPQPLGAQTEDILRELGYEKSEIQELSERSVVRLA